MAVKLFGIIIISHFLMIECSFPGESCFAEGRPGSCKQLSRCLGLLHEIKRAGNPMPTYMSRKLQALGCGFDRNEPLVCCVDSPADDGDNDSRERPDRRPTQSQTQDNQPDLNDINKRGNSDSPTDISNHPNLYLIEQRKCGSIENDRIYGGNRTRLFEMPWMVLLAYDSAQGVKLSCGGTLISERYVLTAAHCVSFLGSNLKLRKVILGEYDIRSDIDCERIEGELFCAPPARNVSIERVIAHPGYRPQTLHDDIALIRLSQPADFTLDSMKPLCLPTSQSLLNEKLEGVNGVVAGWGTTEDGLQSPVLLSVTVPIITNSECQDVYNESPHIYDQQLCAGGVQDMDSCGGDSGGPLMYPGRVKSIGARYVQRGIVSYGSKRCGIGGYPGVYTRISFYMKWILDNISA